jgi:hypothetical protein
VDIAVNLVESYLRACGYLTLTELELAVLDAQGEWRSATDIDVVGIRLPGPDNEFEGIGARFLAVEDPVLALTPDLVDVIIGEVKQGHALFNPALTRPEVLRAMLGRLRWLYGVPLDQVIEQLRSGQVSLVPGPKGSTIRTRLVAFGQSGSAGLHSIPMSHVIARLIEFMGLYEKMLRPLQLKEPGVATLRLLAKSGFVVQKKS